MAPAHPQATSVAVYPALFYEHGVWIKKSSNFVWMLVISDDFVMLNFRSENWIVGGQKNIERTSLFEARLTFFQPFQEQAVFISFVIKK